MYKPQIPKIKHYFYRNIYCIGPHCFDIYSTLSLPVKCFMVSKCFKTTCVQLKCQKPVTHCGKNSSLEKERKLLFLQKICHRGAFAASWTTTESVERPAWILQPRVTWSARKSPAVETHQSQLYGWIEATSCTKV